MKNTTLPKVAFICVYNSCRSQIAEALGKHFAADRFASYSAGTELKDRINPDAVRIMKERYGIDMEATQHPKLLKDIPPVDIVITMGCNVQCPALPSKYREDWGLEDPSGKGDAAFHQVIDAIEHNIIIIHRHSRWFFTCGHSPRIPATSHVTLVRPDTC